MEPKTYNKSATDASQTYENVSFTSVSAVVTGWTLDFMFVRLCRCFKDRKLDEFNEALSTFEAISQSSVLKGKHKEKTIICAFLARVMHGQQLDVQYEEDACVMPLMSATKVWSELEDAAADESLFENITILLLVQSVAVCMEKGQRSSASSALKWLENNRGFPQSLGVKLSKIVNRAETYHPFLMSFSFSRLLETVQSFLDVYLERNPSDFLLKAATKMVQSSQEMEGLEDTVTQDSSLSDKGNNSTEDRKKKENTVCLRTKRKLMPTKITDVWKPDSCKKPFVSVRGIVESEIHPPPTKSKDNVKLPTLVSSQMKSETSMDTSKNNIKHKRRKPPQKWTSQLDSYLKKGVYHHGVGKWARILMDYDFEGRTSIMLKDRWRVLVKANDVS